MSSSVSTSETAVRTRLRIYTASDVTRHITRNDCWVIRNGRVYNVSDFVDDHPGGDDLILKWAGKDVSEIMNDVVSHDHSKSAYDMLNGYLIGKIGPESTIVSEGTPKCVNGEATVPLTE